MVSPFCELSQGNLITYSNLQQVVVEEVHKLAELNSKLSLEAHRTEEDIVNTETALRNNLTMLRKTLQDEIQAKTSLSHKMESEAEDFEKYKNDSSKKLSRVNPSFEVKLKSIYFGFIYIENL